MFCASPITRVVIPCKVMRFKSPLATSSASNTSFSALNWKTKKQGVIHNYKTLNKNIVLFTRNAHEISLWLTFYSSLILSLVHLQVSCHIVSTELFIRQHKQKWKIRKYLKSTLMQCVQAEISAVYIPIRPIPEAMVPKSMVEITK